MWCKEVAQEEGKILDKLLVPSIASGIDGSKVCAEWDNSGNRRHDIGKHLDQLVVILRLGNLQASNFRQTLHGDIPELWNLQKTAPARFQ